MSIDVNATYRDGALHPETPLGLPENTPVRVHVVPTGKAGEPGSAPPAGDTTRLNPPQSPRFTGEQLRELIAKYSVSVGSLPADFSRADIYGDHD